MEARTRDKQLKTEFGSALQLKVRILPESDFAEWALMYLPPIFPFGFTSLLPF